jgi:DNA-binding NarL/FixJ family response regulator
MDRQRIVIAEDHRILREGLRALISSNPDLEVVGEAEDGREAVQCVEKLSPSLVLIDLSMPKMHGIEAIREIKKRSPETRVVALTVHKSEEYVLAALEAGAHGYVLKDASHAELLVAIESVLSHKTYLSPGVSEKS